MTHRIDPAVLLLLSPALVGLALAPACSGPRPYSDPLVPYLGPATLCGRELDTLACDGGWAYQCAPDPGGGCSWRTQGAPCRGEPEARVPVVAGGECGRLSRPYATAPSSHLRKRPAGRE